MDCMQAAIINVWYQHPQTFPGVMIGPDLETPNTLGNDRNCVAYCKVFWHLISVGVRAKGSCTSQMSHVTSTKRQGYFVPTLADFSWLHFPFSIRNCFTFSGFHTKTRILILSPYLTSHFDGLSYPFHFAFRCFIKS